MSSLLREYVSLPYEPKAIKEAIEQKRPIIVKATIQRCDAPNQNKRIYSRSVLEREVENYKKAVVEGRATGECVPAGTEILTENGWKDIKDVVVGDNIFTLNTETNNIEVQAIAEKICKKYQDQMVHIKNARSLDMMLTKGHKVLLWDRYGKSYSLTALEVLEALNGKDSRVSHSCVRRGGNWTAKDESEIFNIPGTSLSVNLKDWACFLGIYIAEGHCSGTKGGSTEKHAVTITQNPGERQDKIKDLLSSLPWKFDQVSHRQFSCFNKELYDHLFVLGNSFEKHIPQYAKSWSKEILSNMLDWMLMGDGRNRKDRKGVVLKEYATISPRLANDVTEIMFKLGTGGTIVEREPEDREIEGRMILKENSHVLFSVHQNTTDGIYLDHRFTHAELVDFNDDVFCVAVPNKTWLMRYNGKVCWTHNCDHPESSVVSLQNVSHILREISWNGNDVVGVIEILNTPKGKIIQELMAAGVKIGVSSRGVGDVMKNESGFDVVEDNFNLICFDLVSDPSTHNAWISESRQITVEEVRKMVSKVDRVNRIANDILKK